jgi:hypothetical protein
MVIDKEILDCFEKKLREVGYDTPQINEIMRKYYEALSEILTERTCANGECTSNQQY